MRKKLKRFLMTHIIRPKDEREPITADEVMTLVGIMVLPLYALGYMLVLHLHDVHDQHEQDRRVDLCRIKAFIIEDGETHYLCSSEKIGENKFLIIHPGESERVDKNPYMNRPVIVYKDGSVW